MRAADLDNAPPEQGVFVNRTLNMRSVELVGYDMDYTLIHYKVDEWEGAAFKAARKSLADRGWAVDGLTFDPDYFTVGLVFDLKLGNVVKATRFGYVVRAQHGNSLLSFDEQREAYRETIVELSSSRFEFMNTLFELSRASLFTQLVSLHDEQPLSGIANYADLYDAVNDALGEAHLGGVMKAEIVADPDRFVVPDPGIVPTLLDQRRAGKKLALITNSDWAYTSKMMAWVFDQYCPDDMCWRDLFDVVIVSANKPRFFSASDPIYKVVNEDDSLLLPHSGPLVAGEVYFAGNARQVEKSLGVSGGQPLYVGDHLFGDVHVTKDELAWRTALIARGLEKEITDAIDFDEKQQQLEELMAEKIDVDRRQAQLRMRRSKGEGAKVADTLNSITARAIELDDQISPLAREASGLGNEIWGPRTRICGPLEARCRTTQSSRQPNTSEVPGGLATPWHSNCGTETAALTLRR